MQNPRRYQRAWWKAVLLAGAMSFGSFAAHAQTTMTLHGFCGPSAATTTCFDNGTITPTTTTLTQFGFTRSPDDNTGLTSPTFELVVLVPNTDPGAGSQTITETGTGTGVTGAQTLTLVSGVFSSGTLDSFLGLTKVGGPNNPFSGFQAGATQQGLSVSGYDVYVFNYGSVTFGSPDPTFVNSGSFNGTFLNGAEIYGLILGPVAGQRQDATALSSTIITVNTPVIPDGGMTLMLLGGALVGLETLRRKLGV